MTCESKPNTQITTKEIVNTFEETESYVGLQFETTPQYDLCNTVLEFCGSRFGALHSCHFMSTLFKKLSKIFL